MKARTERGERRPGRFGLVLAQVLVIALAAGLTARMWYLQIPMAEHYQRLAEANHIQELVVPATRGQILDSSGRALVRNRTELTVSADYHQLQRRPDGGEAVLRNVAEVVDVPFEDLRKRTRLCGPEVPRPCWPGSPYQPITLVEDVDAQLAMQIMERREDFPGITAQQRPVREYPMGDRAAQLLGYLQPVTEEELAEREDLRTQFTGVDNVGRGGVEAVYDDELRGTSGVRKYEVDRNGNVTGVYAETPPEPGAHLVTSVDERVQRATEDALARGLESAGGPADSAAAVVLDVKTGGVVAMASLPTYDPGVWEGGIDQETYNDLLSEEAGEPLTSRALQGQYPPASTFKVNSLAAGAENGVSLNETYSCPSSISVGNRSFENYEGSAHGSLSLHKAIVVSCNTVFYQMAYDMWKEDGGSTPDDEPVDAMTSMAHDFGFGEPTGIDLPHEGSGRVPDREWKKEYWESTREEACKRAKEGYPDEEDPEHAAYLKQVAKEQCTDGYRWRAGDAVNFSIGQGDLVVTPLQLARAYAAIANGGTLHVPRVGKALVSADGSEVRQIERGEPDELPVSDRTLEYLQSALADVPREGTAQGAFNGFPLDEVPVAGKTGTATGKGKKESGWFASYAPADDPQFAIVALISQGGTGGSVAAPVVREIYDGIYGFSSDDSDSDSDSDDSDEEAEDGDRDAGDAQQGEPALPGGEPPAELPTVRPDGSIAAPGESD
ncbi:penicillin-binding protein 2 [Lipingzhangella halophila]|uniref:Penicillin-binding protein 2 n=1 Tax=Lipingzhangella halophila TaxID=1783352 RepID=A0A7W7RJN9_9ACTN|nr:penicillin-binding protein 2 [Lipingzhangella halophila]MBB4933205.1 penicillin-binding protein 2 [Lipingzhangella halophila]